MGGGLRAAGCQDQRQGEGEWKQQHRAERAEKAEQILYERTPPDLGFGTILLDSVWNHQGMGGALLSQQYSVTDSIVFLALVCRRRNLVT
jgi:hypothetical protein